MLFTWHPRLGAHVLWQYFKAWGCFAIALCLACFFPHIIHFFIYPSHLPPLWIFLHYFILVGITFNYWLRFERMCKVKQSSLLFLPDPDVIRTVAAISRRASIQRPRVMPSHSPMPFAGTVSSFFSRSKIILSDHLSEILTEREMRAVIAHEIGHIKNVDFLMRIIFVGCVSIFWFYMLTFTIAAIAAGFGVQPDVSGFTVWTIIFASIFCCFAIVLLLLAHSRACEYLADAASVRLTGWSYRMDLISAIIILEQFRGPFMKRIPAYGARGFWFLHTHPRTKSRAKVLGIDIETLEDGTAIAVEK